MEAFESKGLNANLEKTKVVSDDITMEGMSSSKVDPGGVCSLRVIANIVCVYSVVSWSMIDVLMWKWWLQCFKKNYVQKTLMEYCRGSGAGRKAMWWSGNSMEFTYHGDMVSAGGGCEAAVTARTICWWIKLRECDGLLYGRRFPLRLK